MRIIDVMEPSRHLERVDSARHLRLKQGYIKCKCNDFMEGGNAANRRIGEATRSPAVTHTHPRAGMNNTQASPPLWPDAPGWRLRAHPGTQG